MFANNMRECLTKPAVMICHFIHSDMVCLYAYINNTVSLILYTAYPGLMGVLTLHRCVTISNTLTTNSFPGKHSPVSEKTHDAYLKLD